MMQNLDLEIKVIKKFVDKTKQDRYIQFVSTPKNRHKFIRELAHFNDFKLGVFQEILKVDKQIISTTLNKNKILEKTCYVISENVGLDTKTMDIAKAVQETVGYGMGTILVF